MSKINITRSKNSVSATTHLPYGAYKHACELASAHKGTIGRTTDGFFKAEFDTVETADKFVRTWRADYAEAHAAYTPKEKTDKKASKKSKPSSTKKGNAKKMSLDDYIINNPLCTREEAKAYGFKGTRADLRARKVELGVR